MPDSSLLFGALLIAALILSLSAHEAAHALVAWWRGDPGPKERGRISLSPVTHVHPILTIALPLLLWFGLPWLSRQVAAIPPIPPILFGGARPVMVDRTRFRHPHRDMMWVALAGPLTNFLIVFASLAVFRWLRWYEYDIDGFGMRLLQEVAKWNLILAVFNLFPIPPLDGSRVVAWLLPPPLRGPFGALDVIGLPLVIGVFFFVPPVQRFMATATHGAYDAIAGWAWAFADLFFSSG